MFEPVAAAAPPERLGEHLARKTDKGALLLRRWLGCWIDLLLTAVLVFLPLLLADLADLPENWVAVALLAGLAFALLYFVVCEGRWGRTLGKLASRTIVLDARGRIPGYGRAAVRTALRLIEVNPMLLGGIPAGVLVLATPTKQRLGDLLAGTYVVPTADVRAAAARSDRSIASVFT